MDVFTVLDLVCLVLAILRGVRTKPYDPNRPQGKPWKRWEGL